MKAQSLWTVAPGVVELREHELREPNADEVLVETLATGISRGTERLVFEGRVPENQWAAMRAPLQYGEFPAPLSYGYAAVGVVRAGPGQLLGKRVFVLHPHHDRFIAPAAMCTIVPDNVPDRRAVLAANLETAVNILWDARPLVGERALVIGAGVVGLLATYLLARIPGLDLHVCDPDATRGAIARSFGAHFCAPDAAPGERDLIIHASANPAGLRLALGCAGFEGRIVEASWFGAKECALPLGEAFHSKRLALISTQVGHIAPAMRGRRNYADRLALALSLLADPALDALLGPDTIFAKLPQSMGMLLSPPPGAPQPLCPVVTYI
jgi:2-desacetyl-2-hydroxyethyl bacteriochlorophyllide A dehydrogenase